MPIQVTLIQGGGIGHDLVPAVQRILQAAGVDIVWEEFLAGGEALARGQDPLPKEMLESVQRNGLALKTKLLPAPAYTDGPGDPSNPGSKGSPHTNFNLLFRRTLGLFASVRPLKNLVGLPARFQGVDLLILRELTEDLYAAIEHEVVPGVVQSIKVVTETASRRFFRFAFQYARTRGRKTIHCVHKANILKLADGLFLDAFRETAKEFPDLTPREIIVDNCCMQMVSRPQQFDVLAMGNLYGDILSDLGAGIVGGISATSGINIGPLTLPSPPGGEGEVGIPLPSSPEEGVGLRSIQVFETFHGGDRKQLGPDRANPLPFLLPALDLLQAVGQQETAQRIMKAVEKILKEGRIKPPDLGGQASTSAMAQAIIQAL